MSDTMSPWSSQFPPLFRPQMMIGAATPLWGYFAGAALTGVGLWWMSRWLPTAVALPAARARVSGVPARVPALVVVESDEEPILDAEFVPAPPRPRKAKPVEAKPH